MFLPQLNGRMWQAIGSIRTIPTDRDLRLAVLKDDEVHALVFPCRRRGDGWVDAKSGRTVDVQPTHWQEWSTPPATQVG